MINTNETFKNFVNNICDVLGLGKPNDILKILAITSEFEKEVRGDERRKVLEEIKKEKELHSAIIEMVDNGF